MTDMFIPKKERNIIVAEAVIYVLFLILASYFTICGSLFVRMIPMLYIMGILGVMLFNKPIITIILSGISVITFGIMQEKGINISILLFTIYSIIMVIFGEITGQILKLLYENYKLRKFIKHYHKIMYIAILCVSICIPLFLNNIVNSNILSYNLAKKQIIQYITENYIYAEMSIDKIKYVPSYRGGMYEFEVDLDNVILKLDYTKRQKVSDSNMNNRKIVLSKALNAEINILLRENNLTYLNIEGHYDYSKIATNPDIIRINIKDAINKDIEGIIEFIDLIKKWEKYSSVDRIDISIENGNVSLSKNVLDKKDITSEYILNGIEYEILGSEEGISNE